MKKETVMFDHKPTIGLFGALGVAAGILTLAGVGTFFVVSEMRRRRSVIARAKRVISRNVARARSKANHAHA